MLQAAKYYNARAGSVRLIDQNNYTYTKEKEIGAKTYWTCSKYRDNAIQCKARAVTNNEENVIITLTGTHTNHGSELMIIKTKLIVNEAVSRSAENPNVGPRRYLGEIQNKVDETNANIAYVLPSLQATKQAIFRARKKNNPTPKKPNTLDEVLEQFPKDLKFTSDQGLFLRFGGWISEEEQTLGLIFFSENGLMMMKNSKTWFADGTFKTAPSLFAQVKQINNLEMLIAPLGSQHSDQIFLSIATVILL